MRELLGLAVIALVSALDPILLLAWIAAGAALKRYWIGAIVAVVITSVWLLIFPPMQPEQFVGTELGAVIYSFIAWSAARLVRRR